MLNNKEKNNMGKLNELTETEYVVDQAELCQFIKERLDTMYNALNLTVEDIDMILNLEMEYLHMKGIAE